MVSFQQAVYRRVAGNDLRINCEVEALPPTMFVEIVQILEGIETSVKSVTLPDGEMETTLAYTIRNITLDFHNAVFECRSNNSNGLSVNRTTIQVIG